MCPLWGVAFGLLPRLRSNNTIRSIRGNLKWRRTNSASTRPQHTDCTPPAGWYRDPRVPFQLRWWNGDDWSTNVYMPDRSAKPTPEELVPELAMHDGKWDWPQN